jgi:hypothetical protein
MLFDTKKTINEMQVTTVILHKDLTDKDNDKIYLFHCIVCGNPVIQYQGFVTQILPGLAPIDLPVIARCNNSTCKHKYAFRAVV